MIEQRTKREEAGYTRFRVGCAKRKTVKERKRKEKEERRQRAGYRGVRGRGAKTQGRERRTVKEKAEERVLEVPRLGRKQKPGTVRKGQEQGERNLGEGYRGSAVAGRKSSRQEEERKEKSRGG